MDERGVFTLSELCVLCNASGEAVCALVDEGVLQPRGANPRRWKFDAQDARRALTALRLARDLGINTPGAGLAVELLDELDRLHQRVRVLERLLAPER
ncbi:MAG: MerR family transcriptional regulator [Chromatiales bacterium]|nr:MerR family transcriptional regulator [Chromatiales bacterium]